MKKKNKFLSNNKNQIKSCQYCLKNFLAFLFKIIIKGQLISKRLFGIINSSRKRTKQFNLTMIDLFSYVFWKNLKTPKRHFEIHWPLWFSTVIWQFIDLIQVSTIYFSFEKWNRHMGIIYRYKAGLVFSQTISEWNYQFCFTVSAVQYLAIVIYRYLIALVNSCFV